MNLSKRSLNISCFASFVSLVLISASVITAQELNSKLLPAPIENLTDPPELAAQEQAANRRVREYPLKAPTIPHSIEGFQINKDFNQCLVCHGEAAAPLMKAPTVAASHFANRNGDYLRNVSPRRYFCNQCHVPQTVSQPLVGSTKE